MSAVKHVLVVDDERHIREVVEYALAKEGYRVSSASDGAQALAAFERDPPDLVVLDVMLPGIDGLTLCRRMRQLGSTPILFLSARSEEVDRIVGLEVGGDDYLVKPFSPRELLARVRAVLRRFQAAEERSEPLPRVLSHGRLELDPERFEARFDGTRVVLTSTEFSLLSALLERPGVVLSRAQLMQRAYSGEVVTERTLDTHVRRIRAKFRAFAAEPITTVHGVGYKAGEC